jgi:MFS family permease
MRLGVQDAVLPAGAARTAVLRPPPRHAEAEAPAFLGWQVVAGAFLVTMVGYGAIYSYGAFAEEIAAEFGSTRSAVTLTYVLSGSSCFFVSAISGPLADRVGARAMAACGMMLVGLGLLVAATARSLVEVHAGYGLLIGIGCGFAYVPALAAVQRWFAAHRGLASGLAVSGVGIGTALVPPAAEALSAFGDWRVAFAACGGLAAAVGLCGAMLLHPAPGEPRAPREQGVAGFGPELRSRAFAMAWGGTLLVSVPMTLPYAMLVATARDLGLARGDAVALLGLVGLGSIAGRFLLAAVADAVGRHATLTFCCGGVAASMVLWALARELVALQAFALAFGALQGGVVALLPPVIADRFGSGALGGVLGMLYTSRGVALLVAPPAFAFGIAALPGSALPLLAGAAAGAAGTLLLAGLRR